MSRTYDFIHLRISPVVHDHINKISFESGISKQAIIRQMINKCLTDIYGADVVLESNKINKQIHNEKINLTDR